MEQDRNTATDGELSNRGSVTNQQQSLKEVMWLVMICICYLRSDFWTEELAVTLYFMQLLTATIPWYSNLNCVVGLLLFN